MKMALFQQQNLAELAASLEVHPFDIAKLYGQDPQGLPKELHFSQADRDDIAKRLNLKHWWKGEKYSNHSDLLMLFSQKLWKNKLDNPTRADDLYRGLAGADYQLILLAVNELIQMKALESSSGQFGMMISKAEKFDDILKKILDEGQFPSALQKLIP